MKLNPLSSLSGFAALILIAAAPAAAQQPGAEKPGAPRGETAKQQSRTEKAPSTPQPGGLLPPGERYRLRVGDEIGVEVEPQREYSTAGMVLPDGRLVLKNLEAIEAAGLTLDELTTLVRKGLQRFLIGARIEVTIRKLAPVVEPRPAPVEIPPPPGQITVTGAVQRGGPQELPRGAEARLQPLRVLKAIELAGGFTPNADQAEVEIRHADLTRSIVNLSTKELQLDPKHNVELRDGDSVIISPRPEIVARYVRIVGQVGAPARYELKQRMTVEDLILQAGKLSLLADVENVEIQKPDGTVQKLNLVELQKRGLEGIVYLEDGDIVHIPEFRERILLVGAIPGAGPRKIKEGMTLYEFFKQGSPETLAALNNAVVDLDGAQLMRQGDPPRKIDLKDAIGKPESRDNVALKSGDILFVPARNDKQKNSFLSYLPLAFLFAGL